MVYSQTLDSDTSPEIVKKIAVACLGHGEVENKIARA